MASGFKVDPRGIEEICKSPGMRAALQEAADGIADAANARAEGHLDGLHISRFKVPPYGSAVDTLKSTCVGVAYTKTKMGRLDQSKYRSLSAQNH